MTASPADCILDSPLKRALDRIRIPELWNMLGLEGKAARDGRACRSPFRPDRHPSFSIYDSGRRWKDHGTGEGGTAADFLAKARDLSNREACRELIRLAGARSSDTRPRLALSLRRDETFVIPECDRKAMERKQAWPRFDPPSQIEIEAIAGLRSISEEGVSLAAERGLLFCADTAEGRAWVVTDSRRINAQARKLDGTPWERKGGIKAWTLPGAIGALPVGLREALDFPHIGLLEGGPDLLAAFHLAWCATSRPETLARGKGVDVIGKLGLVAMLGTHPIPEGELAHFKGKRVRIFAHNDDPGLAAEERWRKSLQKVGAKVDGYSFSDLIQFDQKPIKDLNDFAHMDPDQWEAERESVEEAFSF
jgi:hypothetical protein